MNIEKAEIRERLLKDHSIIEEVLPRNRDEIALKYKRSPNEFKEYAENFINNIEERIYPHFEYEENNVFPLVKDNSIIDELRNEHSTIRKVLDNIKTVEDPTEKLASMEKLFDLIKEHEQKEKRFLIPMFA